MRLFVWPEFACDYTCGLAVAVAATERDAQRLIEQDLGEWPTNPGPVEEYPFPIDKPIAFVVTGGG